MVGLAVQQIRELVQRVDPPVEIDSLHRGVDRCTARMGRVAVRVAKLVGRGDDQRGESEGDRGRGPLVV